MSDALAAFLAARWDEREAAAKAVLLRHRSPWTAADAPGSGLPSAVSLYDADGESFGVMRGSYVAAHIAANDPAYVLADIAAKRKTLAGHTWSTEAPHGGQGIARCVACITNRDPYPELWEGDPWPCKTVRLLAEPFSGHPDYAAGWALSKLGQSPDLRRRNTRIT